VALPPTPPIGGLRPPLTPPYHGGLCPPNPPMGYGALMVTGS